MCGIVGYVGARKAAPLLLNGLNKLEYRGYDSAGIAVIENGGIKTAKAAGRLDNLIKLTRGGGIFSGTVGIGHTRWATHGEPNEKNCHPHLSRDGRWAVVHNGIIENYAEIREFLAERGFCFKSDTDTETIAHLLEYYCSGDVFEAIRKTLNRLRGSYALGILYSGTPECFYAVRKSSPLVIGLGEGENAIASDIPALLDFTRRFVTIGDDEIVRVWRDRADFYNKNLEPIEKTSFFVDYDAESAEKGEFRHFMLKEIYEQPEALRAAVEPRIKGGKVKFADFPFSDEDLSRFRRLDLIGCGSAYNACVAAKYFIEKLCRVPVNCELASEYRYRDPITDGGVLSVFVSQSGETADTLAALRLAREKGSPSIAVVNAVDSSIAREADYVLYTNAGPEIAVATTKGYTTQVAVLYLLGLRIAEARKAASDTEIRELVCELEAVPEKIKSVLSETNAVKSVVEPLRSAETAFYIGRGQDYAIAIEAALKLKEISYIHAESYAAGELKHGTISLIERDTPVFAIATDPKTSEKTLSNAVETASRGAKIVSIIGKGCDGFEKISSAVLRLPDCDARFYPLLGAIYVQLIGYYAALYRGTDVDKPRNLAKSVTVE